MNNIFIKQRDTPMKSLYSPNVALWFGGNLLNLRRLKDYAIENYIFTFSLCVHFRQLAGCRGASCQRQARLGASAARQ